MAERWVVNASPLIALARVGCADWLHELADEVVVPEAVKLEIDAGPADQAQQLLSEGRFEVVPTSPLVPEVLAWDLGRGETAVLSMVYREPERTAILDDRNARRCARTLGVLVRGTLNIVVQARRSGLTDSAAEVLRRIRAGGFRLDDATIRRVLKEAVDEDWPG